MHQRLAGWQCIRDWQGGSCLSGCGCCGAAAAKAALTAHQSLHMHVCCRTDFATLMLALSAAPAGWNTMRVRVCKRLLHPHSGRMALYSCLQRPQCCMHEKHAGECLLQQLTASAAACLLRNNHAPGNNSGSGFCCVALCDSLLWYCHTCRNARGAIC